MSGGIQIEFFNVEPITVELPESLPAVFTIDFEEGFVIEANFGIPGPKGDKGDPGDVSLASIGDLADVVLTNIQNGDTLVYQGGSFINAPITELTDGGNF